MTNVHHQQRIVVGIDGSANAIKALHWAVQAAGHSGATVDAVYVWQVPAMAYGAPGYMAVPPDFMSGQAETELQSALTAVDCGAVKVTTTAIEGRPIEALLRLAEEPDVDLMVVGARGSGGLAGLLLGSISQSLTRHCPKPVAVVPTGWQPGDPGIGDRPIVVGLDGSPPSTCALVWAVEEARRRQATVLAIRAEPQLPGQPPASGWLEQQVVDQVETVDHAGVEVACRVASGRPAPVIVHEAADALMVVIGTRHIGRLREMVSGSVGHAVTAACPAPVVVVPRTA